MRRRAGATIVEHSGVGDSQANGVADRAVDSLGEHAWVFRLGLETRFGIRLWGIHPLVTWMVGHAADILP